MNACKSDAKAGKLYGGSSGKRQKGRHSTAHMLIPTHWRLSRPVRAAADTAHTLAAGKACFIKK